MPSSLPLDFIVNKNKNKIKPEHSQTPLPSLCPGAGWLCTVPQQNLKLLSIHFHIDPKPNRLVQAVERAHLLMPRESLQFTAQLWLFKQPFKPPVPPLGPSRLCRYSYPRPRRPHSNPLAILPLQPWSRTSSVPIQQPTQNPRETTAICTLSNELVSADTKAGPTPSLTCLTKDLNTV